MPTIIITEEQLNKLYSQSLNEYRYELNSPYVQNFLYVLEKSGLFDDRTIKKYKIGLIDYSARTVLMNFAREFKYDFDKVMRIISKKREDIVIRSGYDPFANISKRYTTRVDTTKFTELDLNQFMDKIENVKDAQYKQYLLNYVFNDTFFAGLNLVLGDFIPRYNEQKREYMLTKNEKPLESFNERDFQGFVDPFTGQPIDPNEQPYLDRDVIFQSQKTADESTPLTNVLHYLNYAIDTPKTRKKDGSLFRKRYLDQLKHSVYGYLRQNQLEPELQHRGRVKGTRNRSTIERGDEPREKKSNYVPTGRPVGRPKMVKPDMELPQQRKSYYTPTGRPVGRPKIERPQPDVAQPEEPIVNVPKEKKKYYYYQPTGRPVGRPKTKKPEMELPKTSQKKKYDTSMSNYPDFLRSLENPFDNDELSDSQYFNSLKNKNW